MARAATKKGRRVKEASRPPKRTGNVGGSAKTVEQQLFFGRLRRSAKWAFALLAVVFAGTFVFLGVGSGQGAGLLDITHWFGGGGSSGGSVKGLQNKVAKNPKDAQAYFALGQALVQKGRAKEAADAFQHYVALSPRSVEGFNQLAAAYEQRARSQQTQLQRIASQVTSLPDATPFQPGGTLGKALAAYPDPFQQALSTQATQKETGIQSELQASLRGAVGAYQKAAALQPDDPTVQFGLAQTAQNYGELAVALTAYKRFVKRFPDDTFAPEAKKQIKAIRKQLKAPGPSVTTSNQR